MAAGWAAVGHPSSRLGIEVDQVRHAIEAIIGRDERIVLGELGLTPRAKKVIALAMDAVKSR